MEITISKKSYHQYLFIWAGQLISLFGSSVVGFALIWWMTIMTGSAMFLATNSFISILVSTICMPIAGVFSDRYNRKVLIILYDSLLAFSTIIVIILFQFNLMTVWVLLLFMGINSIFHSFHMPTFSAIVPSMVPPEKLMRINSISFFFVGSIQVFAQFIASILWLFFPIHIILWLDFITYVIALIPILIIKIPAVNYKLSSATEALKKPSFFREFKTGVKTLKLIPGLTIIIIMMMLTTFFMSPIKVLLPLYVYNTHSGSAGHFALTLIFFQGGMILGALIPFLKKQWAHKARVIFVCLGITMIGYIILALAPRGSYLIIAIGAGTMGLSFPVISTLSTTYIQTVVPPEKMGRIMSISQTITTLILPLGTILSGPLAEIIGIPLLFFYSAELGLIIAISLWTLTNIRKLDYGNSEKIEKIEEKILKIK